MAKVHRFQGTLRDQHTTQDGCEYLRISLQHPDSGGQLLDAEFIFLPGEARRMQKFSLFPFVSVSQSWQCLHVALQQLRLWWPAA